MKIYKVSVSKPEGIANSFEVKADNIKDAKSIARFLKARENMKGKLTVKAIEVIN